MDRNNSSRDTGCLVWYSKSGTRGLVLEVLPSLTETRDVEEPQENSSDDVIEERCYCAGHRFWRRVDGLAAQLQEEGSPGEIEGLTRQHGDVDLHWQGGWGGVRI